MPKGRRGLGFCFDFALRQRCNNRRAGDHGHECEGYEDLMHDDLLGSSKLSAAFEFDVRVTQMVLRPGTQICITSLARISEKASIKFIKNNSLSK